MKYKSEVEGHRHEYEEKLRFLPSSQRVSEAPSINDIPVEMYDIRHRDIKTKIRQKIK